MVWGYTVNKINGSFRLHFNINTDAQQAVISGLENQKVQKEYLCDVLSDQVQSADTICMNSTSKEGQDFLMNACRVEVGQSATYTTDGKQDISAGFEAEHGPVSANVGFSQNSSDSATFVTNWNTDPKACSDNAKLYVKWGQENCERSKDIVQSEINTATGCK